MGPFCEPCGAGLCAKLLHRSWEAMRSAFCPKNASRYRPCRPHRTRCAARPSADARGRRLGRGDRRREGECRLAGLRCLGQFAVRRATAGRRCGSAPWAMPAECCSCRSSRRLRGRPQPYPREIDLAGTPPLLVDAGGNAIGIYQRAHVDDLIHFADGVAVLPWSAPWRRRGSRPRGRPQVSRRSQARRPPGSGRSASGSA